MLATNFAKAQYCTPTYTNLCISGDYIDRVEFAGIDNSPAGTGCNGNPDNFIYYAADTGFVIQGGSYTLNSISKFGVRCHAYGWSSEGEETPDATLKNNIS